MLVGHSLLGTCGICRLLSSLGTSNAEFNWNLVLGIRETKTQDNKMSSTFEQTSQKTLTLRWFSWGHDSTNSDTFVRVLELRL